MLHLSILQNMHSTHSKLPFRLLVIGLVINGTVLGQTNFSGTWTLQHKQLITGPQYANALPKQLTMRQETDSLIIESVSIGAGGNDATNRQAIALNGQSTTTTNATTNRKLTRSLKWTNDKKAMVLTTVFYRPDNPTEIDFSREETWNLSPDGKQLNIDKRSVETRSETWQVKGTYNKQ